MSIQLLVLLGDGQAIHLAGNDDPASGNGREDRGALD
jgi:hypothetical protein